MPTSAGWAVVVTALVLGGSGLWTEWVELLVLAAVALAAFAVGLVWVVRPVSLVVAQSIDPIRVTVGDDSNAHIRITNHSHLPSGAVIAEEPCGDEVLAVAIPRLRPGAQGTVELPLPTQRRARLDIGPLTLVRRDPLGLWRRTSPQGDGHTLWVHPRRLPIGPQASGRAHHLDGPTSDRSPAGTITFHTIREYVEGDDLRFVHWRSTARTGTLMVRQNVDTARPYTVVLVDTRAEGHDTDSFETAMEVAASIAGVCSDHNFPVRLVTTAGDSVGGPSDPAPLHAYLDLLAGLVPSEGIDLSHVVPAVGSGSRGACLTIVAGCLDEANRSVLAVARKRFDRAAIVDVRPDSDSGAGPFLPAAPYIPARSGIEFARSWNEVNR